LNVEQIFQSLQKGKISPSRAKKLLSLYSIEKIGNIAQIDTGRKNRKGFRPFHWLLNQMEITANLNHVIRENLAGLVAQLGWSVRLIIERS